MRYVACGDGCSHSTQQQQQQQQQQQGQAGGLGKGGEGNNLERGVGTGAGEDAGVLLFGLALPNWAGGGRLGRAEQVGLRAASQVTSLYMYICLWGASEACACSS